MSEAAPISVFVVLISTKTVGHTCKVGACYWNEVAAREECERLEAANSYTTAIYVQRQLPWPTAFRSAADEQPRYRDSDR